jgi:hypothetical protein
MVFYITEFVNVFGFVMMQWHSEAEKYFVPNNMHKFVVF